MEKSISRISSPFSSTYFNHSQHIQRNNDDFINFHQLFSSFLCLFSVFPFKRRLHFKSKLSCSEHGMMNYATLLFSKGIKGCSGRLTAPPAMVQNQFVDCVFKSFQEKSEMQINNHNFYGFKAKVQSPTIFNQSSPDHNKHPIAMLIKNRINRL